MCLVVVQFVFPWTFAVSDLAATHFKIRMYVEWSRFCKLHAAKTITLIRRLMLQTLNNLECGSYSLTNECFSSRLAGKFLWSIRMGFHRGIFFGHVGFFYTFWLYFHLFSPWLIFSVLYPLDQLDSGSMSYDLSIFSNGFLKR